MKKLISSLFFPASILGTMVAAACAGTAPAPTQTPSPTPNIEATVEARVRATTTARQPTPTSVIPLQRPPVQPTPTLAVTQPTPTPLRTLIPIVTPTKIPVPTLTPTPQALFKSEKFNRLINFVEKNYFKVPANYISLVYSKEGLSDITDVSLGIPFVEAFSIVDQYTHYNFFYVGSDIAKFPQFKEQVLGRGWKTYQSGAFGQNGRFYDTWIRFENERFVTITVDRRAADLATAVDGYLFNKPGTTLNRSIIDKAYGIIPEKFDNKVSEVFMLTYRREVGATFKDSEGSFTMRVRDDAKIEDDLGFAQQRAVKNYGELRIGNYSTRTVAIEPEGRTRTQSFFYCRTGVYCKVDAYWSLLPSPIGIKSRLEDYLNLLPSFFDKN